MKSNAVPIKALTIYNNALSLSYNGEINRAVHEYKKAIDAYPLFLEAYNNIGEIYSRTGMSDQAKLSFQKALEIDKNHKILLNLGIEYYNTQDYKNALNYFFESITIKPKFIDGNLYSGLAYFNLKDFRSAEKFFKKVLCLEQKHLKANYLLSIINYDKKDYITTLNYLNNIKNITSDKPFLNKFYGFCFYHLGRYNEAVEYLTIAIETNPKYIIFKDYLKKLTYANKLKEIGDVDGQILEMEEKMMKNSSTIKDYTHLSMLYVFKGEYKKAEDLLLSKKNHTIY